MECNVKSVGAINILLKFICEDKQEHYKTIQKKLDCSSTILFCQFANQK